MLYRFSLSCLFVLLLSSAMPLMAREAPRDRIVPFRSNYTCSGTWQKVMVRRTKNSRSYNQVGYRCISDLDARRANYGKG